jgi:riboflavin synthase
MNGRLDGHLVQGHVDSVAICLEIVEKQGSWEYTFEFDPQFASLIIEKGSITVNGISLTLFDVTNQSFRVAIIPYTYEHTNMKHLTLGDEVNVEFDLIGKYINRMMELKK